MSSYLKKSEQVKCNLCGNKTFIDFNQRKNVRCEECSSLERTRLLWMYLENLKINKNSKILHIGPEEGIYNAISKKVNKKNYVVADLNPKKFPFAENCVPLDLCYLEGEKSLVYDIIIHSHVLEHVTCNIAYPLYHLHRMLKKTGTHVCIIPFLSGRYDECFQKIGDDERVRRFGQFDHVRRFGREDIDSHVGSILDLPIEFDAREHFSEKVLIEANIPEEHWTGFGTSTVLTLKRNDMKLLIN